VAAHKEVGLLSWAHGRLEAAARQVGSVGGEGVVEGGRALQQGRGALGGQGTWSAEMGNCYLKKINYQLHYQLLLY